MSKPIVMIGGGGHASVLTEILLMQNFNLIAYVSPSISSDEDLYKKKHHLNDAEIFQYPPDTIELINGIGSIPGNKDLRYKIFNFYKSHGYTFASVISPKAIISPTSLLKEGVQVMHGAIIQRHATIGNNSIINTASLIEHDCNIGSHIHIAPGVTICGGASIDDSSYIGCGSTIIQSINIGENVIIGAGSTIRKNISKNSITYNNYESITKLA